MKHEVALRYMLTGIFVMILGFIVLFSACSSDSEDDIGPDCDLSNVTYAGTIAPIMQANCNSCHSGSVPSAGIVTADYQGLQAIALDGRLLGTINHDAGFSPMPKGQPQLDECLREQIALWVNEGAPDN